MWVTVPSRTGAASFEYDVTADVFGHDLAAADPWAVIDSASSDQLGIVVHHGNWIVGTRDRDLWLRHTGQQTEGKALALALGSNHLSLRSDSPGTFHISLFDQATLPRSVQDPRAPGFGELPAAPRFLTLHALGWEKPSVCAHVFRDSSGRRSRQQDDDIEYWIEELNHFGAQAMVATSGRSPNFVVPLLNPVRRYSIRESLGATVAHRQRPGTIFDVLRKYKDQSSDVNIFWVWSYQSRTADFGIGADPVERIIVIQDNLRSEQRQLAIGLARILGITRPIVFQGVNLALPWADLQKLNDNAARIQRRR